MALLRRTRTSSRTWWFAIAAAVVVAATYGSVVVVAAAVPTEDVERDTTAVATATDPTDPTTPSEPTTTPEPSTTVPALGVAAGTCADVVYTPPTASSERTGTLCLPTGDAADTAILLIHGGGGVIGDRSDLAAWQAYYQDDGYATLSTDYALLESADDAPLYPLPEQNAKAAVQWLRLHLAELGSDQIVVQGHSAGARLGGVLLTTPGDASFDGRELWPEVSDAVDGFIGFYGYYDGVQFEAIDYYGGDGSAAPDATSIARASDASAPVLLIHGDTDTLIRVDHSVDFAVALRAAGTEVETMLVAGANHGFDGYDQAELTVDGLRAADRTLAWLQRI